jgi:hypothetical protein
MSFFDNFQKVAFGVVTTLMGDVATWQPSDGSDYQTAEVLLKEPTNERDLGDVTYSPYTYIIEYYIHKLTGLKNLVDSGTNELITINEIEYYVRKVDALHDGKTYKAILEKV